MAIAISAVVIALACHNEVLSLILLSCGAVWGLIKLADEMSRGGYR